ncbi:MAG: bacteriohemerythrin [Sterolibacterium sp.]
MSREIFEISKLFFELTVLGGSNTDLERLLQRLFGMLGDFPSLAIEPHGAILLFNPRRKLVQVAQHGMDEAGSGGWAWDALHTRGNTEETVPFLLPRHCALAGDVPDYATNCRFLILPLHSESGHLGYACLASSSESVLSPRNLNFFTDLGRALSVLVGRAQLDAIIKVREWELEEARTDAIHRLGSASEYRDNETGWHVMRMTNYALAIARQMNLPEAQRDLLFVTAPMHDVGKIGIPDAVLLKQGLLDEDEMKTMRSHAEIGETILSGHDQLITTAREIAAAHHEYWDGKGYPRGLAGEQIPLLARICAVADVFDALTSRRPYKDPWPLDEALAYICKQSGSQFDPSVVEAFCAVQDEVRRVRELYRDDIIDPKQVLSLPSPTGKNETWVRWDDTFSVGIDIIDEHHRYLFDIVNELHGVVANRRGGREVARLLKALDLYALVHFRAEERMMEHYGFAGLSKQQKQHQAFHDRMREFHEELHANPLTAQHDVLDFARSWLVGHIRDEDTQLRVLAGRPT